MHNLASQNRVRFDFEILFSNGGGIRGQDFRLDIDGEEIGDREVADLLVRDLRLLMAASVRILKKEIIREPHKRLRPGLQESSRESRMMVDLSHSIESGMITYKGLPAPLICDFMSREDSKRHYSQGTTSQIGRIEMVANTGTYLDSPFHRFEHGKDVRAYATVSLS